MFIAFKGYEFEGSHVLSVLSTLEEAKACVDTYIQTLHPDERLGWSDLYFFIQEWEIGAEKAKNYWGWDKEKKVWRDKDQLKYMQSL